MSTQVEPTTSPTPPRPQPPTALQQRRDLLTHLLRYHSLPPPRQIFHFLHNLSQRVPLDLQSRLLRLLQPRTELQLEYFLEAETHADDWCVTFPDLSLIDIFDRDAAAKVNRASKTTWRQFRESDVAEPFMQHIDTVTFAADWNTPSRMHVVVKFTPNSPLRTSIFYNHFEEAYERLDLEYIKLELKRVTQYWRECWRPAAMTYEVIHIMAADLRKMYNEMVW
jgi:hypothetical protein